MRKFAIKTTGRIGVIASTALETGIVAGDLKSLKKRSAGGLTLYEGRIGQAETVCVISGIGKTNASHAATVLIRMYSPSRIINFGVGGAYPSSGLKTGDIAVATKEVYADEGVLLKDGYHSLQLIDIPLLKTGRQRYFNEFPLDARLGRKALNTARAAGFAAKTGVFATVSTCTGTNKRAREISKRLGAICENMEGAAVAHICRIYSLPCIEVRGISNMVEERDVSKWEIRFASEHCQRVLIEFMRSLKS